MAKRRVGGGEEENKEMEAVRILALKSESEDSS